MSEVEHTVRWTHNGFMFKFIPVKMDFSDMDMIEEYGPIVEGRWFWADWLLSGATYIVQFLSMIHPNPETIQFEFRITECIDPEFEDLFVAEDDL